MKNKQITICPNISLNERKGRFIYKHFDFTPKSPEDLPKVAEIKEKTTKGPLGLVMEHARLVNSLEGFVGKHEKSLNEKIRAAANNAREALKTIKHGDSAAERHYFFGDEKFKAGILKDIHKKLELIFTLSQSNFGIRKGFRIFLPLHP